jgi:glycosyltransferase involved in cell wall biosynthesis
MSRVLLVSYYFPPVGGAGSQRPAALARLLPQLGHSVEVLTGSVSDGGRWTPRDETLANGDVRVERVGGPEPSMGGSRLDRWLMRESPWSRWWRGGLRQAILARASSVDLVYVIMSPYESAAAVADIAAAAGLPWVADLGDPWALDEMLVYPSRWHRRRELRMMRQWLRSAAAIVMSTPEAVRRVRAAFPELAGMPVLAIPNGYDAGDFVDAAPVRSGDHFRIVHTGYLHTELGLRQRRTARARRVLGGAVPGVDIYTRSHVFLLEAVARLLAAEPALADRLEVVLAGVLSPVDIEIAERSRVTRLLGYVPHAESVALLRSADLIFLPMQNLPAGRRATIVPGKTYEYLASGTRILAAVPEGDARDMLQASGNAFIVDPDDVEGMQEAIREAMDSPPPSRKDGEHVAQFEWRSLARRVADVIDSVVASGPSR